MMPNATLTFVIAVVSRGGGEKLSRLFAEYGTKLNVITLGHGTASRKVLTYLGLGETVKDVLYCVMDREAAREALPKLCGAMDLRKPGGGIAFSLPLGAAGRTRAEASKCAEGCGMEPFSHDLILAVTNAGYADEAMEAARAAGATGGTIIHARGVGMKQAEKFFGVTVQAEKQVLFTVVPARLRQQVMDAIIKKSGPATDAGTVVFSLPVEQAFGLTPAGEPDGDVKT